jgi:Putative metal-binding motif
VVIRSPVGSSETDRAARDGNRESVDRNDANPSIRPGTSEVPDNSVDENCDGADAVNPDRDNDGVLRPLDCDDGNRRIRPGAREVRGNRIDENCSGSRNPAVRLARRWAASSPCSGDTRFRRLTVRHVPRGELRRGDDGAGQHSARRRSPPPKKDPRAARALPRTAIGRTDATLSDPIRSSAALTRPRLLSRTTLSAASVRSRLGDPRAVRL